MAYLTKREALAAVSDTIQLSEAASSELRKSSAASLSATFDIFLSHSYEDARLILGVKRLLEGQRLSVYVDWIEDNQLNRAAVTFSTAETLRQRLRRCRYLLFATSQSSPRSRWMPWELGYFDGRNGRNKIGILPLVDDAHADFAGQEYLGIYPRVERNDLLRGGRRFEVPAQSGSPWELRELVYAS
jgi:hypothetical protein